ncbi:hypothetical protein BH23ACT9_BH23ACT9_39870 [soil metagenome]
MDHPAATRPDALHAVCVFAASAETVSDTHRALARELGAALAGAGWRTVYGGGQAGLMGELAHGALDAGGPVTGIIPDRLNSRERAFDSVTELVLVDSLAERKQLMDVRSDAFAVLPGGIGTLDELTDVMTTLHLGFHDRPLVLVDPDGFWDPLQDLLAHMVAAKVMTTASVAKLATARSTAQAVRMLAP